MKTIQWHIIYVDKADFDERAHYVIILDSIVTQHLVSE